MPRQSLEITTAKSGDWAVGLEQVKPRPGRVNRLVMQPLPDGRKIPKRIPRTLEDIKDWFWTNVETNSNGCMNWKGPLRQDGYGTVRVNGKKRVASRVAWLLRYGSLPPDKLVCHRCDNPPCVNPDHLFLGDDKANHRDAVSKGRKYDARGDGSPVAKIHSSQINEIVRRIDTGESCRALGRELGVHHSTISSIVLGKTWKSVDRIR